MKKILFLLVIILAIILRIYNLGNNPPALYWDETSLGYNAYSILTSLRDEHDEFMPIARFIAFGDYKPPGYIYVSVPSIFIFGLTEFAVRFPSMLAGILLVVFTYFLVKELFTNPKIALLASFILAISPWAIQFSRAAFEANLAALFNLLGIYFFLISKKNKFSICLAVLFFILSFYTFNSNRIIAPILVTGLSILHFRELLRNKRWTLFSIILGLILLIPSIKFLQSRESRLRFAEVSIFNNLEPVKISNNRIESDNNIWWSKIIHNRRILFGIDFLKHYFDNFSGRFLFTHGDVNPRLSTQVMGQLYVWELTFLLFGIYILIRKKEKNLPLLVLWMIVAPIPAATARETPHALRILSILPTFQIIIAFGLYQLIKTAFLRNRFVIGVLCFIASLNIFYYLHNYYVHYPRDYSGDWQYGYKQMVSYVSSIRNNYDQIYITQDLGRPYIYFAFYEKYSHDDFKTERNADRDWFGFWNVKSLGNIRFESGPLPDAIGRVLLVTTKEVPGGSRLLQTIKDPKGKDIFFVAEKI